MGISERQEAVRCLAQHGLLDSGTQRPSRRWHGALARAARRLVEQGDQGEDLRIPVTLALIEQLGDEIDDHRLAAMVDLMLPFAGAEPPSTAPDHHSAE